MNPEVSRPLTVEAVTEKVRMDAIIRLCDGAFPTPIAQRNTYPAMLDKLDRYGIFFAACTAEPVGYAAMYANDQTTRTAFMTLMSVKPGCQGMGIGKQLMERCFAAAKENGMVRVRLEVRKNNPRAISLYERYGFLADGQETDASVFMTKSLV